MPELPELEVVREVLGRRVVGSVVESVTVLPPGGPIVVRDLTGEGFAQALAAATVAAVERVGKFLVLTAEARGGRLELAINPKLSGRLQLAARGERRRAATWVVLSLAGTGELRYVDSRKMGQLYLSRDRGRIPELAAVAPDALAIGRQAFRERLQRFRGEIKGVLTRGELVAGIGNAYADEILWAARIHPYRKRTTLGAPETDALYDAMRATLATAIEQVRRHMGERIDQKPREFLSVHLKAGEPCPRCGRPISVVGANQTITNFCRNCQPGGLLRGM